MKLRPPLSRSQVTDQYGAVVPDLLRTCAYHAVTCVGDHGDRVVKIKIANEGAFCNECYIHHHKRQPAPIGEFQIPGVSRSNAKTQAALAAMEENLFSEAEEMITENTPCAWKPDRKVTRERGLVCTNTVLRNPETRALEPCCGWHATACVLTHAPDNAPDKRAPLFRVTVQL